MGHEPHRKLKMLYLLLNHFKTRVLVQIDFFHTIVGSLDTQFQADDMPEDPKMSGKLHPFIFSGNWMAYVYIRISAKCFW